jgi:hypothetical protein
VQHLPDNGAGFLQAYAISSQNSFGKHSFRKSVSSFLQQCDLIVMLPARKNDPKGQHLDVIGTIRTNSMNGRA